MFLFWGEYDSDKDRGVVVDKCLNCGRVAVLRLTQRYRKSHLYFIPLGAGKLLSTFLTCTECNGNMLGTIESYTQVLPQNKAKGLPTGEILQQTNPRLAEALAYRAQLEQEARDVREVAPGRPDPRVKLALARLSDLDARDQRVIELQARLAQWGTLDSVAQAQLLRDIEALIQQQKQQAALVQFIRSMAQRFEPDVDAGLSVVTFLIVVGLSITVAVYLVEGTAIWIGILVGVGGVVSP